MCLFLNKEQELFFRFISSRPENTNFKGLKKDFLFSFICANRLASFLFFPGQEAKLNFFTQTQQETLQLSYLANLSYYQQQTGDIQKICRYFEAKKIALISLKGIALNNFIYGQEAIRPASSDIDLLVKENDFYRASQALREMGYRSKKLNFMRKMKVNEAVFCLEGKNRAATGVDLHTRLAFNSFIPDIKPEFYWHNPSFFDLGGMKLKTFSKEMLFIYLCILIIKEKRMPFKRLIYFLDLHYFFSGCGRDLDYGYLEKTIAENNFNVFILIVLRRLKSMAQKDYSFSPAFLKKIKVFSLRKNLVARALPRWQKTFTYHKLTDLITSLVVYSGGYIKIGWEKSFSLSLIRYQRFCRKNNLHPGCLSWVKYFSQATFRLFKLALKTINKCNRCTPRRCAKIRQ